MSSTDAVALIESLNVDELVAERERLEKRVTALDILIRSARAFRGESPAPKPGKPAKPAPVKATVHNDVPAGGDLLQRIIMYLNQHGSARLVTLAADINAPLEEVQSLVCEPTFTHRGVGYWAVK